MYSKLTLFGKGHSGKTTTLRYLAYLLFKHNNRDLKQIIYLNDKVYHVINAPFTTIPACFTKHRNDFKIILIYNNKPMIKSRGMVETNSTQRGYSVCICTAGDDQNTILANWKFASYHKTIKAQDDNTKKIIIMKIEEPNIFVSPCRTNGLTFIEEQNQQRMRTNPSINSGNKPINLHYWIRKGIDGLFKNLVGNTSLDKEVYEEAHEKKILYPTIKKGPMVLTPAQHRFNAQLATLMEEKIYELANLL